MVSVKPLIINFLREIELKGLQLHEEKEKKRCSEEEIAWF